MTRRGGRGTLVDDLDTGPFGRVLQSLTDAHRDTNISLAVLEPTPEYYRDNYGSYPVFTVPARELTQNYWSIVSHEPDGDSTGSIAYTANVVGITGSTGAWAVWAERSWDLAIVLSQSVGGAWLSVGVDFVAVEEALADFTEPDFKIPLLDQDRATFLDNVRIRGASSRH